MQFVNPAMARDSLNEGLPYLFGPAAQINYALDDCRIETLSAGGPQFMVKRAVPGLLGSRYCIEFVVTAPKSSIAAADNDNFERWLDPVDIEELCWGTPYAKPLTISFDAQAAVGGAWSATMLDWQDHVACVGVFCAIAGLAGRKSVTFPPCYDGDFSQGAKFVINLGSGDNFKTGTSMIGVWQSGSTSPGGTYFVAAGSNAFTTQPSGSYLRFGRWQFDIGVDARPYRPVPDWLDKLNCQRFVLKTMPDGIAVNNAARAGGAPAGMGGSLMSFQGPYQGPGSAGLIVPLRFPIEMAAVPQLYSFSPGLPHDSNWLRRNGNLSSALPVAWDRSSNDVSFQNTATGDPNGSSYGLHVVAIAQRGGNGFIDTLATALP